MYTVYIYHFFYGFEEKKFCEEVTTFFTIKFGPQQSALCIDGAAKEGSRTSTSTQGEIFMHATAFLLVIGMILQKEIVELFYDLDVASNSALQLQRHGGPMPHLQHNNNTATCKVTPEGLDWRT